MGQRRVQHHAGLPGPGLAVVDVVDKSFRHGVALEQVRAQIGSLLIGRQ